jgi:hypothetical protein
VSFFYDDCWVGTFSSLFSGVLAKSRTCDVIGYCASRQKQRFPEHLSVVRTCYGCLLSRGKFLPAAELVFLALLVDPVTLLFAMRLGF